MYSVRRLTFGWRRRLGFGVKSRARVHIARSVRPSVCWCSANSREHAAFTRVHRHCARARPIDSEHHSNSIRTGTPALPEKGSRTSQSQSQSHAQAQAQAGRQSDRQTDNRPGPVRYAGECVRVQCRLQCRSINAILHLWFAISMLNNATFLQHVSPLLSAVLDAKP